MRLRAHFEFTIEGEKLTGVKVADIKKV